MSRRLFLQSSARPQAGEPGVICQRRSCAWSMRSHLVALWSLTTLPNHLWKELCLFWLVSSVLYKYIIIIYCKKCVFYGAISLRLWAYRTRYLRFTTDMPPRSSDPPPSCRLKRNNFRVAPRRIDISLQWAAGSFYFPPLRAVVRDHRQASQVWFASRKRCAWSWPSRLVALYSLTTPLL